MNSGYRGSTALTQDMSKTGGSMSSAKARSHLSTTNSLSTAAAIPGSAPMRLNNNIGSATPGTEGLATVSEQVCILTAFKQKLLFACTRHINQTALCKQTDVGNHILQMLQCLLKLVVSSSAV